MDGWRLSGAGVSGFAVRGASDFVGCCFFSVPEDEEESVRERSGL